MYIYQLSNIDMGDNPNGYYKHTRWTMLFSTVKKAKNYAEGIHGPITWKKNKNGSYTSGVLTHMMYIINTVEVH